MSTFDVRHRAFELMSLNTANIIAQCNPFQGLCRDMQNYNRRPTRGAVIFMEIHCFVLSIDRELLSHHPIPLSNSYNHSAPKRITILPRGGGDKRSRSVDKRETTKCLWVIRRIPRMTILKRRRLEKEPMLLYI